MAHIPWPWQESEKPAVVCQRQWLLENEPEIRSLETAIRRAYLAQELHQQRVDQQLQSREQAKIRHREDLQEANQFSRQVWEDQEAAERVKQNRVQYGHELQSQAEIRRADQGVNKAIQKDEEHALVDEIIQHVQEVERVSRQREQDERFRLRSDIQTQLHFQKVDELERLEREKDEELERKKYWATKADWADCLERDHQDRLERREAQKRDLSMKLERKEMSRKYEETLLLRYWEICQDQAQSEAERRDRWKGEAKVQGHRDMALEEIDLNMARKSRVQSQAKEEQSNWARAMEREKELVAQRQSEDQSQKRQFWQATAEDMARSKAQAIHEEEMKQMQERKSQAESRASREAFIQSERVRILEEHAPRLGSRWLRQVLKPGELDHVRGFPRN